MDDAMTSKEDLSRQVSQLSKDSGASNAEIKHYLSIDEVLERSRLQTEELTMGTEARDFAAQLPDPVEVLKDEFPKNRRNGASPILARAAMKAVDLVAKRF